MPRTLYFKLLASFGLVLALTLVLALAWAEYCFSTHKEQQEDREILAQVILARQVIAQVVEARPDAPPWESRAVRDMFRALSDIYGAQLWVEDSAGEVMAAYPAPPAAPLQREWKPVSGEGDFFVDECHMEGDFYIKIPVSLGSTGTGTVFGIFPHSSVSAEIILFLEGLGGVALLVALLVVPIARLISSPLRELEQATLRYAEGDLSLRVPAGRKDEIGRLGQAFNLMAGRMEDLVRGSRELVAHVSHEIRSPLARLRMADEMSRERLEHGDLAGVERQMDSIREEIETLDRLIGRILDLSRLDFQEQQPGRADLWALAGEVARRFAPEMERRGITFASRLEGPGLAEVPAGDAELVLSNLLDNAVKFCADQGTVSLTGLRRGDRIGLAIANSAPALPAQALADIFRPFHRIGRTDRTGYGLGLAIVQKAVQRTGGEVTAHNAPEGFRIEVLWPASS